MKVLIIGGGIGGLSASLALRKYLSDISPSISVKVYESHSSPTSTTLTIGGGLGLAPNGLRAIYSVSAEAAEHIQSVGFHGTHMTFRNSAGALLGKIGSGRKERYDFDQVLLARAAVHEALLAEMPEGAVIWGEKVREVRETEDGVEVEFEDGNVEKADLVIGADGVRSIVREAVVGKEYQAQYDGFTGIGGFLPVSSLPDGLRESLKEHPVTMTFGAHGFFGYSPSNSSNKDQQIMWWSTYEADPPPSRDSRLASIRAQLLERHASWKTPYDTPDPVFSSIISLACGSDVDVDSTTATTAEKNVLILPRYITPRLPRWCTPSGRIMLLGDAAHAMPPDSGQGVSCAAEDSLAIALLLKHYLTVEQGDAEGVLRKSAGGYERVRMGRVAKILDMAKRRGDNKRRKTWWEEWLRDWILWILSKLPESINDSVFAHNVETEVKKYIISESSC